LNRNVTTLADNDKTLAQSLDKLCLQTERKIHEAASTHGKEIVKISTSLDIVKKQVWEVSQGIEPLMKKP